MFSFPNIFLTLLGGDYKYLFNKKITGIAIDKYGVNFGVFTFSLTVMISQLFIYIGVKLESYSTILFWRAILGISAENLSISQTAFVTLWFRGKELSTAIGLIITIPEIASALNSYFTPILYKKF